MLITPLSYRYSILLKISFSRTFDWTLIMLQELSDSHPIALPSKIRQPIIPLINIVDVLSKRIIVSRHALIRLCGIVTCQNQAAKESLWSSVPSSSEVRVDVRALRAEDPPARAKQ